MDYDKLIDDLRVACAGNQYNIMGVAATALPMLQAENEKLRDELEQVKQKYSEAQEAICAHCMDVPCRGERCYWWCEPQKED